MHPEVQELQTKLKEILYDCAVEVRATKAALYLRGSDGRFELITEYGFRGAVRAVADRTDPVIDRCGRGRTPFFLNGLTAEAGFSHLMFESSSDRLLAAPIYLRGQLVGVIDMRDKGAKALFDNADLPKAQRIADRVGELFASRNVFGQRFITLSEAPERANLPASSVPVAEAKRISPPAAAPAPAPASAEPAERRPAANLPRLATLIIEARSSVERIAAVAPAESIGEAELVVIRDMLRSMLLIPGAALASVSAYGHMGGVQELAARSALTEEAMNVLQSKLNLWLTRRGEPGGPLKVNVTMPFGTQDSPIGAALIQKVFTAPVEAGSLPGLFLTVVFSGTPDRGAHELLTVFHGQLRTAIEHSMARRAMQASRSRIAVALVEPDFAKYPELRRHTDAVTGRVEAFTRLIAISPADAEIARIVAVVHDVGMRLLDYGHLYRKSHLSPDEFLILKEHPAVGAAIVEPLLGYEIARAVLCHHERWDGRGYPNELHGSAIPLASRIVQICDAYETMISTDGYARPESLDDAAAKIAQSAGSQFDPELTRRFSDMLRAGVA